MRLLIALFVLVALAQAVRVRDFVSSILGESPKEIQSQVLSDFSDLLTITATDSSALASISSEIQSAIDEAISTFSTELTLTSVPTITATSHRKNDASAVSSYSGVAAFAALLMSVVFFQAL